MHNDAVNEPVSLERISSGIPELSEISKIFQDMMQADRPGRMQELFNKMGRFTADLLSNQDSRIPGEQAKQGVTFMRLLDAMILHCTRVGADEYAERLDRARMNCAVALDITPWTEEALSTANSWRAIELLKMNHYTDEMIAEIQQRFPTLDMVVLPTTNGESFHEALREACAIRDVTGMPVVFRINRQWQAVENETEEQITEAHEAAAKARHDAYWTPERLAEKELKKQRETEEARQAFARLPQYLRNWVKSMGDENYGFKSDVGIANDAYLICKTLRSDDAIVKWWELPAKEQKQEVPGLVCDSGNSASQAAILARRYLRNLSEHPLPAADDFQELLTGQMTANRGKTGVKALLESSYNRIKYNPLLLTPELAESYAEIYAKYGWNSHASRIRSFSGSQK